MVIIWAVRCAFIAAFVCAPKFTMVMLDKFLDAQESAGMFAYCLCFVSGLVITVWSYFAMSHYIIQNVN